MNERGKGNGKRGVVVWHSLKGRGCRVAFTQRKGEREREREREEEESAGGEGGRGGGGREGGRGRCVGVWGGATRNARERRRETGGAALHALDEKEGGRTERRHRPSKREWPEGRGIETESAIYRLVSHRARARACACRCVCARAAQDAEAGAARVRILRGLLAASSAATPWLLWGTSGVCVCV